MDEVALDRLWQAAKAAERAGEGAVQSADAGRGDA
jgi:hypothetical protein